MYNLFMEKEESAKKALADKICAKVAGQLRKAEGSVKPNHRMKEDLAADSLDIVEMMMGLEEEYGITIPDDVLPTINTIGDIADYIYLQTNNKK
jgi:acyl carrier protein